MREMLSELGRERFARLRRSVPSRIPDGWAGKPLTRVGEHEPAMFVKIFTRGKFRLVFALLDTEDVQISLGPIADPCEDLIELVKRDFFPHGAGHTQPLGGLVYFFPTS